MSGNIDPQIIKIKLLAVVDKLKHSKPEFRYASGILTFGFLITFISPLYDFFSLISNHIFNFQLWKLLTCSFFEPNFLVILYQLTVAYQFFHLIEPVWGYAESLKFTAIVQLLTPLFIAFFALLNFALFNSYNFYYYGNLNGMAAVSGGVLVAIKQFLPDTVLVTTPFGRIKNNHLPGISVIGSFIFWIFGLVRGSVVLQIGIGIQIGWTYLRYYQIQNDTHELGDHSEHFAWATLFPRRAQPAAIVVGKAIFRTLTKLKICKRAEYTGFEQFVPVDVVLPTPESRDAERRRQKALRDLNERLGRTKTSHSNFDIPEMDTVTPEIVVVPEPRSSSAIPDPIESTGVQHSQSANELRTESGNNY